MPFFMATDTTIQTVSRCTFMHGPFLCSFNENIERIETFACNEQMLHFFLRFLRFPVTEKMAFFFSQASDFFLGDNFKTRLLRKGFKMIMGKIDLLESSFFHQTLSSYHS